MKAPDIDIDHIQVWPTHWAGGSNGTTVDGHNTIWLDTNRGEIARMRTEEGRVTERVYATAKMLASSKSLAACLHRQMERLRTMPNWELITRPTKAEMVEEMRQALLEAGYQDA